MNNLFRAQPLSSQLCKNRVNAGYFAALVNEESSLQRQKTVARRRDENYALKFFNEEILMSKLFTAV
jgi:hypothetical protein